ncbi:hypothetical protein ID866_6958 [Astraeus odoratus]|nr:hypothetical protein ID866_6958 [Astraeus odoratus]
MSLSSSIFPHLSSDPSSFDMDFSKGSHLIVVSNRLPITITKDASGEYHFKMSSGGLVSALSGFKKYLNFTWIGWPGFFIPPKDRPHVDKRLMEEYSCQAVYLEDDIADRHYNGFSNSILWPLFHYHPGEMNFDEENWTAYRQANMRFAEAVRSQITPGAMVWVQDYHLMLLPMMLRGLVDGSAGGEWQKREMSKITEGIAEIFSANTEQVPGVKIGFFLHTPFPSSEIYRILPVRREILLGILFCDLIGFHTYDYARHFLSSCTRILGLPTMPNGVEFEGRLAHVGTFPIGIEPASFIENLKKQSVTSRVQQLEQRFAGVKLIVGVDRLDYIKGVPQKLHALELFLTQHPEWIGKVSYEYIACQQARQGVLILSEFAGAAQSLNGSIVVNPWDSQQVADAIHEAVTMDADLRAENHRKLFKYVNKYSAAFWGTSFIREMSRIQVADDSAAAGAILEKSDDRESSKVPPAGPSPVADGDLKGSDEGGAASKTVNGQVPTPQVVSPAA